MILDLYRQDLSVTAIARRAGGDPKKIRKYIERGFDLPAYGPRRAGRHNKIALYLDYIRQRVATYPALSAVRMTRKMREARTRAIQTCRRAGLVSFPRRPPGRSACRA